MLYMRRNLFCNALIQKSTYGFYIHCLNGICCVSTMLKTLYKGSIKAMSTHPDLQIMISKVLLLLLPSPLPRLDRKKRSMILFSTQPEGAH